VKSYLKHNIINFKLISIYNDRDVLSYGHYFSSWIDNESISGILCFSSPSFEGSRITRMSSRETMLLSATYDLNKRLDGFIANLFLTCVSLQEYYE